MEPTDSQTKLEFSEAIIQNLDAARKWANVSMRLSSVLLFSYLMISCESNDIVNRDDCIKSNQSDTTFIGYNPINISQVNSEFDDYNSYVGFTWIMNYLFIFSTNRNSSGDNFDITSYNLVLISDYSRPDTSTYKFLINEDSLFCKNLDDINTNYNEYGPYLQLIDFTPENYSPGHDSLILFITRDDKGQQDILYKKFSHLTYDDDYVALEDTYRSSVLLNSDKNDAYVSVSSDFKKLFFCSDRTGNSDIYQLSCENNANIYNILYDDSASLTQKVDRLNSSKDEKCPFVNWNIMVFTSNRSGGYGGYDLYYSMLEDNEWSEPINFGDKINTEYNEFRPVTIDNNVMIFSSDRPCGKGGFDLYIVRITNIKK
jgi:hypothetical protein